MNKRIYCFLVLILCLTASGSAVSAAITVENATATWESTLEEPTALITASGKVTPRIMVEYATALYEEGLSEPTAVIDAAGNVEPRIVVEYATSVFHNGLEKPTALLDVSEKVSPRIVVVYPSALFKEDLVFPFEPIPGDFNRNGRMDLGDVIRVLNTLAGNTFYTAHKESDVSGDDKVGFEEALHIFREIAR